MLERMAADPSNQHAHLRIYNMHIIDWSSKTSKKKSSFFLIFSFFFQIGYKPNTNGYKYPLATDWFVKYSQNSGSQTSTTILEMVAGNSIFELIDKNWISFLYYSIGKRTLFIWLIFQTTDSSLKWFGEFIFFFLLDLSCNKSIFKNTLYGTETQIEKPISSIYISGTTGFIFCLVIINISIN